MIYLILLSITILFLLNVLIIYSLKRMNSGSKNENNAVNISVINSLNNEEDNISRKYNNLLEEKLKN